MNLDLLVRVNYKEAVFSAGIIDICAKKMAISQYDVADYKKSDLPPSFWALYKNIQEDLLSLNKEIRGENSSSKRAIIAHRHHSLKPVWDEIINPSGQYSVFLSNEPYESIWNNLCLIYPSLRELSLEEGGYIIKTCYDKFFFNGGKGFPSFFEVANHFAVWNDKSNRHLSVAIEMKNILEKVSKVA